MITLHPSGLPAAKSMSALSVVEAGDELHWQWIRATPWEPQALSQRNFPPIIAAALVEALLYGQRIHTTSTVSSNLISSFVCAGVHVLLFALTVLLLLSNRMRLNTLMLGGLVVMLGLSTADIALTWSFLLREPQSIIARCYVVWNQRWYILPGFGIPLLAATGFGYASKISRPLQMRRFVPIYIVITLILNNVLTILTGKEPSRSPVAQSGAALLTQVNDAYGRRKGSQYRTTSAIIVESGLLYSLSLLLLIGLSRTIWVAVAGAITLRIVCIAPVMIIVQIALGHGSFTSRSPERSPQARTRTVVLDTIVQQGSGPDENSSSMQLTTHASSIGERDR
ncbi:hypothetical protein NMY22_g19088 [Coprinellus aureogranulatus]|nr:hypothetical protein NMY22_g19088 [Coprinellus aureogranulatus]